MKPIGVLTGIVLMTLAGASAARAENFGTVEIAPAEDALTFARFEAEGQRRLLLVSGYEDGLISGVDLTEVFGSRVDDPIDAYAAYGYSGLSAAEAARYVETVPLERLVMPVDLASSHIAAGTNFPEHADEATVEDGPFLFPKEVAPTAFNAPVSAGGGLLDYEVELCFVALADIDLDNPPDRTGLLLCNDYTDRAKLMRHLDPDDVASGKGFTTGKSAPGFLPVGNLFVIPRDLRTFAPNVELRLYRDGVLKQSARQSHAIWDFDELLRQAKARADIRWEYEGGDVGLPINGDRHVPVRTAFLGGTPSGTIFQGVHRSAMLRGAWDWVAGGWNKPLTHWVIEQEVAQEASAGRYLRPGERVQIVVDLLGEIDTTITE